MISKICCSYIISFSSKGFYSIKLFNNPVTRFVSLSKGYKQTKPRRIMNSTEPKVGLSLFVTATASLIAPGSSIPFLSTMNIGKIHSVPLFPQLIRAVADVNEVFVAIHGNVVSNKVKASNKLCKRVVSTLRCIMFYDTLCR